MKGEPGDQGPQGETGAQGIEGTCPNSNMYYHTRIGHSHACKIKI